MVTIEINYKNKDTEKKCLDDKTAIKKYGKSVATKLRQRIMELKAAENLQDIKSTLPWRREKLKGSNDMWSIRIDNQFRLIIKAIDLNYDIQKIKIIEIEEVSNHYE